jgi:hypothetical protein
MLEKSSTIFSLKPVNPDLNQKNISSQKDEQEENQDVFNLSPDRDEVLKEIHDIDVLRKKIHPSISFMKKYKSKVVKNIELGRLRSNILKQEKMIEIMESAIKRNNGKYSAASDFSYNHSPSQDVLPPLVSVQSPRGIMNSLYGTHQSL